MSPAALDIETGTQLRAVIGRLSRRLRPTAAAVEAGLTPTRVSVLLHVERAGPVRLSELGAAEGINPTMLSRVISQPRRGRADRAHQRRGRSALRLGHRHRGRLPSRGADPPRADRRGQRRARRAARGRPAPDRAGAAGARGAGRSSWPRSGDDARYGAPAGSRSQPSRFPTTAATTAARRSR